MKKTICKIEILFMALICIFAMSGMPVQVYAGLRIIRWRH